MKNVCILLLICFVTVGIAQENTPPDFILPDLEGNNYQLSKNYGEGPILINFWATWCIPCKAEMKKLKKLYKKYKDDGLQILSISIDDPKTVSKVRTDVRSNRYPFTILLDTNSEIFQLYKGTYPPLSIIIDKDGQVAFSHNGYRKGDEKILDKKIQELINNGK